MESRWVGAGRRRIIGAGLRTEPGLVGFAGGGDRQFRYQVNAARDLEPCEALATERVGRRGCLLRAGLAEDEGDDFCAIFPVGSADDCAEVERGLVREVGAGWVSK